MTALGRLAVLANHKTTEGGHPTTITGQPTKGRRWL